MRFILFIYLILKQSSVRIVYRRLYFQSFRYANSCIPSVDYSYGSVISVVIRFTIHKIVL